MNRLHPTGPRWYWGGLILFALALVAYARQHDIAQLYTGYRYSEQEVDQLEERLQSLQEEEQKLQQNVEDLDNDPLAVEAEIRRSKGLVREGETVYRVELPSVPAPQDSQDVP